MESRLHVVVLPEEDGPASSTSFTSGREAICSAMEAIFFSCKASLTLMMSVACPPATASLKSPTVRSPRMRCQAWCSLKMSNILSCRVISGSTPGSAIEGMRSSNPS